MTSRRPLPFLLHRTRQLSRLAVAGVAVASLLGSGCQQTAAKDTFSDTQVSGYARSAIEIARARKKAIEQIQGINGTAEVPEIACSEEDSLEGVSTEVQAVAVDFCTNSLGIVEENGLSIEVFNEMTRSLPEDADLAERINGEIAEELARELEDASEESPEASPGNPEQS